MFDFLNSNRNREAEALIQSAIADCTELLPFIKNDEFEASQALWGIERHIELPVIESAVLATSIYCRFAVMANRNSSDKTTSKQLASSICSSLKSVKKYPNVINHLVTVERVFYQVDSKVKFPNQGWGECVIRIMMMGTPRLENMWPNSPLFMKDWGLLSESIDRFYSKRYSNTWGYVMSMHRWFT